MIIWSYELVNWPTCVSWCQRSHSFYSQAVLLDWVWTQWGRWVSFWQFSYRPSKRKSHNYKYNIHWQGHIDTDTYAESDFIKCNIFWSWYKPSNQLIRFEKFTVCQVRVRVWCFYIIPFPFDFRTGMLTQELV